MAPARTLKTTECPTPSVNTASVADTRVMVPASYGFSQPAGGLPAPSLSGWTAT